VEGYHKEYFMMLIAVFLSVRYMPNSQCPTGHDKTVEFRRFGVGGVNWIIGDSRLSPSGKFKAGHVQNI